MAVFFWHVHSLKFSIMLCIKLVNTLLMYLILNYFVKATWSYSGYCSARTS